MFDIYKSLIRPLFFKLDPELSHEIACSLLSIVEKSRFSKTLIRKIINAKGSEINICGINFPNRIGLAAGFDKNGLFPGVMSALGFGHVEIGTVTPEAQKGNPKPRLYRVPEEKALINRMGFNNHGSCSILKRIEKYYPKLNRPSPLGVNIGKAKSTPLESANEDYLTNLERFWLVADYITINVSSPNTQNLRELQQGSFLQPLLQEIDSKNVSLAKTNNTKKVPCFVKISPDESFSTIENILRIAHENNISGIIATNTTNSRPNGCKVHQKGGWSGGNFLKKQSSDIINFISKLTQNKMPIIAAGGVWNADSALEKIDAGASLVQFYTSFVYEGPSLPKRLLSEMNHRNSWFT